jgi:hypothetical protein
MNLHRKILTLTMVAAAICLASACAALPAASNNSPTPGLSEADIRTQAVETVLAAITGSAPVPSQTASVTPQPSLTATQTAVPTENTPVPPTLTLPALPTPTITYTPFQTDFRCEILDQNPGPEGDTFEPDAPFDISVTFKNTGDNDWKATHFNLPTLTPLGTLFIFTNGKYMQKSDDPIIVPHTDAHHDAHLVVDMKAPDTPGAYVTSYSLYVNHVFFCPVHFSIKVK